MRKVQSEPTIDESQASQILDHALDGGTATSSRRSRNRHIEKNGIVTERDLSASPQGAPRYHYFGLTSSTQTESQLQGDCEELSGSQKENMVKDPFNMNRSSRGTKPRGQDPSTSKQLRPSVNKPRSSPMPYNTASNKGKSATKPTSRRASPQTRRSTFPPIRGQSQDSFTGAFEDEVDPATRFIEEADQFEVPLSQLPRVAEEREELLAKMPRHRAETIHSSPLDPMQEVEGVVLVAATPSASDGSQSQGSDDHIVQVFDMEGHGQGQAYPDTDVDEQMDNEPSQPPSEVSAPSSSYNRFINGEVGPDLDLIAPEPITQDIDATQPYSEALSATQIASQEEPIPDGEELRLLINQLADCPIQELATMAKHLRSIIDYSKSWRFKSAIENIIKLAKEHGLYDAAVPVEGNSLVEQETQPSGVDILPPSLRLGYREAQPSHEDPAGRPAADHVMEETQPSTLEDVIPRRRGFPLRSRGLVSGLQTSSEDDAPGSPSEDHVMEETQPSTFEDVVPRRRGFPARARGSPANLQRSLPQQWDHPAEDNMDIVPDSEPPRAEHLSSIPAGSFPTTDRRPRPSPSKKVFRPLSPDPHPDSGEIVPDSVEMDAEMEVSARKEGREDQEDDDDEVPLAKAAPMIIKGKEAKRNNFVPLSASKSTDRESRPTPFRAAKGKGKQRAAGETPDPATKEPRQTVYTNRAQPANSWEGGFVPSSMPEQDGVANSAPEAPADPPTRSKRIATTAKAGSSSVPSSSKRKLESVRDELSPLSDVDDETIPKVEHEGRDDGTEPADEDEDYEESVREEKGNKKRKRSSDLKAKYTAARPAAKRPKRAKVDTPPTTRAKSLRSSVPVSSSKADIGKKPTRVYALWKDDGHYYLGTVHSVQPHRKYSIKFDDGTCSDVTLEQMRRAELKVGDEVTPGDRRSKKTWKVVNVDDQHSTEVVTVNINGEDEVLKRSDILIHMKTVNHAWNDRRLVADAIVTRIKPPLPSPSRLSISSTVTYAISDVFEHIGFVITLSPKCKKTTATREEITKLVHKGRGTVVNDWSTLMSLDGTFVEDGRRWVITEDEVQWLGDTDVISKVFLVSDEPNEKPRYFIALALGIPCLSYKWLEACLADEKEVEYRQFLLPQGFVDALEAQVSQFVDLNWCGSPEHLRRIMENKVPPKLMKDKSVLCVGRELVPVQGRDDVPGSHFIGQILVCMGASSVEAVKELRYASKEPIKYDFVVIKERDDYKDELEGSTVVDTQWVKWSLVAGRALPLPEWSYP